MPQDLQRLDHISRRAFAAHMARACLGVGLAPLFGGTQLLFGQQASGGKATRAIYLFMSGGMTHLDTYEPKPGSEAKISRSGC